MKININGIDYCTYQIGFDTFEESEFVQLYHEKLYSKNEFQDIINKICLDIVKNTKKEDYTFLSFEYMFYEIVESLLKDYGFKKLKYDIDWRAFGWSHILDKDSWSEDRNEEDRASNCRRVIHGEGRPHTREAGR